MLCHTTNVKMFCLLPTKCKQQQIAILIISFFLYVNGIRNEGNNMLQQQQQQQQQQQPEQQQQLQLLHATIENSNYQSSSSSNSVFKPSPIIEFTLADVTVPQRYKSSYEEPKYPSNAQTQQSAAYTAATTKNGNGEMLKTKANNPNDNRRYSATFSDNGESQFLFPNQQQHVYPIPQQQHYENGQYQQHPCQRQQDLTEMPIYIYKDPYTNENYHYTPTEATILETAPPPTSATYTGSHNDYSANGYKQQHRPTILEQDDEEYLVHSSMLVGAHQPQRPPNPYQDRDKDVYLKRPGFVYDESYIPHSNAVLNKKRDNPQTTKTNKISYDSHDYPPPSYAQQQTSNFLPTPVPDIPPAPRPTQPPKRLPPSYASAPPPRQDYRPRPPPQSQQEFTFGRPQQYQQQQYLQSTQNTLPNYANNLDNYLSNKQQGPHYQRERPPPAFLQQQQQQQDGAYLYYESGTPPPSYRPQQLSSYPLYESPQYHHQTPPPPPPYRPSYNNYYDYQIGEIPPQAPGGVNYPYPRPPNGPYRPPPPAPTQQPSGLATLVQYAPQFTSLLLGGGGGGSSSNSNNPLGSLFGVLTGAATSPQAAGSSSSSYNSRPINAQLIRALENIARNDDLQCVPKVLCQMIAGQTERGQLPSFITSPTITNFLAGFPAMSPALIYGRAALLGLSGGDKSCHETYVKCPKNEVEIIYYLNNHRGGFFKFFSEPEAQPAKVESQTPPTSLFSILAALTGSEPVQSPTTPRPEPPPSQSQSSSDITGSIGNFFTKLLSDYMGEGATVEYQRRRRRRSAEKRVRFEKEEDDANYNSNSSYEDYNDEEDSEDTQQNVEFVYEPESTNDDKEELGSDTQSRIIHRTSFYDNKIKFFPERDYIGESSGKISDDIKSLIQRFNDFNKGRRLKFPTATGEREYVDVAQDHLREAKELDVMESYSNQYTNYEPETFKSVRDSKKITFHDDSKGQKAFRNLYLDELKDLSASQSSPSGTKVVFPEREGRILNNPYYAASYNYHHLQQNPQEVTDDKFVVPNNQRPQGYIELSSPAEENYNQRPHGFNAFNPPTGSYNQRPQFKPPEGTNIYNGHVTSLNSINNYVSNVAASNNYYRPYLNQGEIKPSKPNNNYFLPTPAPEIDIDYDYTNSIDLDENYNPNNPYYSQYFTNNAEQNSLKYTSSSNYNSYRPLRKPSTSSSSYDSSNVNKYYSYRPSSSNNSAKPQSYPANSSFTNNRYHSSLYTTKRPTTTTKSSNKNIYVTNARGETEYYITPDGRKVYL